MTVRLAKIFACAAWVCSFAAMDASAVIITQGGVAVTDENFMILPIPIGPGDTNTGDANQVVLNSATFAGGNANLTVNDGSKLTAGGLVTFTDPTSPGGSPAAVNITGTGSSIELSRGIDFASQRQSNLTISSGGSLTVTESGDCATYGCYSSIGNAAGSQAVVTVTGNGSTLQLTPPVSNSFTQIGQAVVLDGTGFGDPGGSSTANVSILDGGTMITSNAYVAPPSEGDGNTGTESVSSIVTINGSGSSWVNSGLIAVGTFIPASPSAPDVSGTIIVSNDAEIVSSELYVGDSGTLAGNGTVVGDVFNHGGLVSPGLSPGTLAIDGNYEMDGGTLLIEVGGLGSGQYDILDVTGAIEILAGEVLFDFVDGFLPEAGDTFDFMLADTISVSDAVTYTYLGLAPGFEFAIGLGTFKALTDGAAVPAPATLALFGLGIAGLGWSRRKKV